MSRFSFIIGVTLSTAVITFAGQAPPLAERGSPIRTGIWMMQKLTQEPDKLSALAAALHSNPNLSGVCLGVHWKDIEKEAGKPDFGPIDRIVSVIRQSGTKYQICLKPGVHTPAYVFAEGAQSITATVHNRHRPNFGQAIAAPIPWDPIYEREFSRMIGELGKHYASDPLCVSVVLTCANFLSAEMHLPKEQTDLARWAALGNYGEKLLDVYKKFTDVWAQAFPKQEVSLHLSKTLDLPPAFAEHIIDYGLSKYPQRFTIQNCQLSGRREDMGKMSYDLVLKYRDRAHHGFQSLADLSHPNERMGSIEMAVLNVVHAQGEYWELWHGDGMDAQTSAAVAKAWDEGKRMGYEAYKQKLISEGKYPHR